MYIITYKHISFLYHYYCKAPGEVSAYHLPIPQIYSINHLCLSLQFFEFFQLDLGDDLE